MKTTDFKNIVMAIAIGLLMVSCGGKNANKKQADNTSEVAAEQAVTPKKVENGSKWPDNHFTKQVPKLEFAINSDGVDVEEDCVIVRFRDAKPTKEQIKAYWEKIKAAGFTNNVIEVDDSFGIQNTASNAAGYSVQLNDYAITIRKR